MMASSVMILCVMIAVAAFLLRLDSTTLFSFVKLKSSHNSDIKLKEVLIQVWEEHMKDEFAIKDTDATMETMTENPYVNHVPVMTGGVGVVLVKEFYAKYFIPTMPPDTKTVLISRTVGNESIVDEMIFSCTHSQKMDWFLPGVEPTGKYVEVPLVAIVKFEEVDDPKSKRKVMKVAHEHIYWDQASVLVQIGLLDPEGLPVEGIKQAAKLVNPRGMNSRPLS